MSQNVTIVQIAEESGVSIATVSRVLSGNVPVSPKTRARVEAVIKKYNYTPNSLAQGLILRQSKTLGVIVPDITNPYFSALFHVIERVAHQAHYSVPPLPRDWNSPSNSVSETSMPVFPPPSPERILAAIMPSVERLITSVSGAV